MSPRKNHPEITLKIKNMEQANKSTPSATRPYSMKNTDNAATATPGTKPFAPSAILKALIKPTQTTVTKIQPRRGIPSKKSSPHTPTSLGINSGQTHRRAPKTTNLDINRRRGVKKSGLMSSAKPNTAQRKMAPQRYKLRSSRTTPGV